MGTLASLPLPQLLPPLIDRYGLTVAVETGTFYGASTQIASRLFKQVFTIDTRADYQDIGRANCDRAGCANIRYLLGDSRLMLPHVVADLAGPAFFWLDGHSVAGLFGPTDDCPILEELRCINASPYRHYVFIDDAHCFDIPVPHDRNAWPENPKLKELAALGAYAYWREHDIIIIAPPDADALITPLFAREM